LSEDAVKAHPLYKDLETRYAAAHLEIDGKKTKKQLEAEVARLKVLAGEEGTQAPAPAPMNDARKMQEEITWNIKHESDLQLAGQPYYDFLARGYAREDALTLALAKRPDGEKALLENLRAQQSGSSGGGSLDRTPAPQVPGGLPADYVAELKKKHPTLSDEKIAAIAKKAAESARTSGKGL
jgi:hypothetical protein